VSRAHAPGTAPLSSLRDARILLTRGAGDRAGRRATRDVGSGEEIAIADLVRMIAARVGFTGEIRFDPRQPDGQPRRRLSEDRLVPR